MGDWGDGRRTGFCSCIIKFFVILSDSEGSSTSDNNAHPVSFTRSFAIAQDDNLAGGLSRATNMVSALF
jgi:hypothetical protein